MLSRIRKHLNPATALAFVALVFALTGGAFAATGGGSSPSKATASAGGAGSSIATAAKAKAKTKAGPRGPAGPKGATGAAGATGATGPGGATGPSGAQGLAGTNGTNGTNGEPGKEGPKGNEGKEGKEGSPWTAGGTLPSKATETGNWAIGALPAPEVFASFSGVETSISFGIQLKEAPTAHVIQPGEEGKGAGCPVGSSAEKPEAESGNLCIFIGSQLHINVKTNEGAMFVDPLVLNAYGAVLAILAETEGKGVQIAGTWAVTG